MARMSQSLENEFGTLARWTHEAVGELGPRYAVPAACRGSGTPAALDWLLARLAPAVGDRMLDVGAGLGGPAAFARDRIGVHPVCVDPMHEACDATASLFGLPALVGDAARLPFADASFTLAWSLGTLCTTRSKADWLAEMSRVLSAGAPLGLLVVVSTSETFKTSWGNEFPSDDELGGLLSAGGFEVTDRAWSDDCPAADASWQEAEQAVEAAIRRRHQADPPFAGVRDQEARMTELLHAERVRGRLLVARAR
jgi:SAM-dependent methyltransferase